MCILGYRCEFQQMSVSNGAAHPPDVQKPLAGAVEQKAFAGNAAGPEGADALRRGCPLNLEEMVNTHHFYQFYLLISLFFFE